MSTKRDLTEAQQRLNRAVDNFIDGRCYNDWLQLVEARDALREVQADFDGDAPAARRQTSIEAAKRRLPLKGSMRRAIVETLVAQHVDLDAGMTCDELERRLRKSHQTVSPAVNYLEQTEWIVASEQRRQTRLGADAIVWRPTDKAIAHIREAALGAT